MSDDHEAPAPTIQEIVDALLLFDEPILNHRFHNLLARHAVPEVQASLQGLPHEVVRAERSAREGAAEWEKHGKLGSGDDLFQARSERALIESFLSLAESQIRTFSFLARGAPDYETRAPFDAAAERVRGVATVLRRAASRTMTDAGFKEDGEEEEAAPTSREGGIQILERSEGLRERVETAIRRSRRAGREPRLLALSHTAYRHLRDEGCFRNRQGTIEDVPASIEFGWDEVAFAVLTYDAATLEEIYRDQQKP